tara:strand:- start:799 stop:1035 length:237 start_codon:yes stop_codon:yes gene_type:complete
MDQELKTEGEALLLDAAGAEKIPVFVRHLVDVKLRRLMSYLAAEERKGFAGVLEGFCIIEASDRYLRLAGQSAKGATK